MTRILIDTDVILDFFFDRQPFAENASKIFSLCESKEMDKDVITQALNSDFKDFEDALQNYSAELDKEIDLIITRNIKDFKNSKLAVMTPDNYMKSKSASH